MKKVIALLVAVMFAAANPAFAATALLSDTEMDTIAAGDWVVLTDASGNQTVESELYYSTNDIKLEKESQKDIQAVSNTNAVDSAVAVQTNIASVTGEEPINNNVNQSNEAHLTNYNPSEASSHSFESTYTTTAKFSKSETLAIDKSFSLHKSYQDWFILNETFDLLETLNISAAYAAAWEEECKNCETEGTETLAFLLDYDKTIDYDKNINKGSVATLDIEKTFSLDYNKQVDKEFTATSTKKAEKSYRKNLSENNHIDLEDTSQQNIQAVSNLNTVGSAVAVQTNIATNVGVAGSITHSNTATAINGL